MKNLDPTQSNPWVNPTHGQLWAGGYTGGLVRGRVRIAVQSDYDECQLNSRLCQHVCENLLVGYRCSCKLGYQLQPDRTTCSPKRPQFSGITHTHV